VEGSTVHVLATSVALVVALAAAPTPTPFPLGTLQPFGAPGSTAPPLPNIGRVRSATPACAAMRDLIIPSYAAAQRSDVRFAETRKRLPNYAELVDNPLHVADVYRQSALAKIDGDATKLLEEAQLIAKALGDPRLSAKSTDPEVLAERNALEQLYEGQMIRANLLNEFVIRQQAAIAKNGIDTSTSAFAGGRLPAQRPTDQPIPALTAPPGMPLLMGNDLSDKQMMNQWSGEISAVVYRYKNAAAKTFLPIARKCSGGTQP
jgi:hypothetical protein